jgi:hypothetical protein
VPAPAATRASSFGLPRGFRLLPDEDPEEYARHEAIWLTTLNPTDLPERAAALAVVRAMWREMWADRLEAQVLTDLFAANRIEDEAETRAAKQEAMRALAILIRYRGRIQRDHDRALAALEALRQRVPALVPVPSEPEPHSRAAPRPVPPEPERPLNRHERRALAARERQERRRAA